MSLVRLSCPSRLSLNGRGFTENLAFALGMIPPSLHWHCGGVARIILGPQVCDDYQQDRQHKYQTDEQNPNKIFHMPTSAKCRSFRECDTRTRRSLKRELTNRVVEGCAKAWTQSFNSKLLNQAGYMASTSRQTESAFFHLPPSLKR